MEMIVAQLATFHGLPPLPVDIFQDRSCRCTERGRYVRIPSDQPFGLPGFASDGPAIAGVQVLGCSQLVPGSS